MKKIIAWIVLSPIIVPACIIAAPFLVFIWAAGVLGFGPDDIDIGV